MGIETEYGLFSSSPADRRGLDPDELARKLFRPVVEKYSSSNIFTHNSSRLYLDVGSHPEVATAECDSLTQLLNHERAGDLVVDELARATEDELVARGEASAVYLFKNNVDSAGNSYGCHENYLVSRHLVLKELSTALLPFFITRQLICGAGRIKPTAGQSPAQFVLSQRADQVWEGISSATTRSRPIINTRDEPHGDSSRFRRMHVIVGDSNMAEPTFALKVGSALLMLEMLEAGFDVPSFAIAEPIAQMRAIAGDQTGQTPLTLADGSTIPAIEVQRQLASAAARWLDERPDAGTLNSEMRRVVDLWGRTVTAVETQDFSQVDQEIDWVIKKKLLDSFRAKLDCDWSHPKLAQVDLTYHDIRSGRGLYSVLSRRGLVRRWTTDEAIAAAREQAPATTRAALRGKFLTAARQTGANVTVDWTKLKVNRPEPRVEQFLDPFVADDARLQPLLDYMQENQGH